MRDLVIATFCGARYRMRRYRVTSLSEVPLYKIKKKNKDNWKSWSYEKCA